MSLQSSNTTAATVPASVTVPAGSTSANFTITTFACCKQHFYNYHGNARGKSNGHPQHQRRDFVCYHQKSDFCCRRRNVEGYGDFEWGGTGWRCHGYTPKQQHSGRTSSG